MMAFGFFSRYVDGDHFTRFGDGEDFRQQRIVTALDRKADFLHRFADTHEQTDRFAVCRSADMLGNAGADFVDSFDFYVSYVFRQLFLSLEGRIFAGDFSFFRYEVYQVMDMDDVTGCEDARDARFTMLVDDRTIGERMHSQP